MLWFYFGYQSYFTLHDDNAWTYQRAEQWLADQACEALLDNQQQSLASERLQPELRTGRHRPPTADTADDGGA